MKECITHHHACDYREGAQAALVAQLQKTINLLRNQNNKMPAEPDRPLHKHERIQLELDGVRARAFQEISQLHKEISQLRNTVDILKFANQGLARQKEELQAQVSQLQAEAAAGGGALPARRDRPSRVGQLRGDCLDRMEGRGGGTRPPA